MLQRVVIALVFAAVLGVPLLIRLTSPVPRPQRDARVLVVATPHVPQIRAEFGEAFTRWHERVYKEPARIDWRAPGQGTSEIVKLLEAQYTAAAKAGRFDFTDPRDPTCPPGTIAFDVLFGGGSYDHGKLKRGVKVEVGGKEVSFPMSVPAGFLPEFLRATFGENAVGIQQLYDPEQYWIGTALSGFGIVSNRAVCAELGVPVPTSFEELADPRLVGMLILTEPRQSGSVTTTMEALLNAALWKQAREEGWEQKLESAYAAATKDKPWYAWLDEQSQAGAERGFARGWGLLRRIMANARSVTASGTKPPIDVSAGEGAAGLAIDFYGRGQAQAVLREGQSLAEAMVVYHDPRGAAYIDADPVTILRGGPDRELARRFVEFCLTDEAQLLWQLPPQRDLASRDNPKGESGERMGPRRYALHRLPVRRDLYARYGTLFIDQVNPFEVASKNRPSGWRDGIGPVLGAFGIDNAEQLRRAWRCIIAARSMEGFSPQVLAEMERRFDAMPYTPDPRGGEALAFTAANFGKLAAIWKNREAMPKIEIAYTTFFRREYAEIVRLFEEHERHARRRAGASP